MHKKYSKGNITADVDTDKQFDSVILTVYDDRGLGITLFFDPKTESSLNDLINLLQEVKKEIENV